MGRRGPRSREMGLTGLPTPADGCWIVRDGEINTWPGLGVWGPLTRAVRFVCSNGNQPPKRASNTAPRGLLCIGQCTGDEIPARRPCAKVEPDVQSDADFVLVVAWTLACLRNRGPYPVIVLSGEQGSAKSTFSAILRAPLDPNTAPLRALPREDRDLFIAASNGHVLAFDNVSGLPAWISDTLCRLATGGASRCASSIPIRTRFCSTPPVR